MDSTVNINSEFSTYQHEFNVVDYLYLNLQIYKMSELKVKGQGHGVKTSIFG